MLEAMAQSWKVVMRILEEDEREVVRKLIEESIDRIVRVK